MKAFLLNTFSVGTLWWGVLGEPTDRASYPLIICVRSGGSVVASNQMTYDGWGFDKPVKITYIDISGLSDGEYEVTIENDTGCNGQFIMGRWYVLLNKSALSVVFNGASPCRSFAAILYNNRLYYWYGEGCTAFVHPGSTALVEFVDSVGNGYVDLKTWNTGELVNPNVKVPFWFSFDINISGDPYMVLGTLLNIPGMKISYSVVDSNTIRVYVYKDSIGLPIIAIIALIGAVAASIFAVGYLVNSISNLVVSQSKAQTIQTLTSEYQRIASMMQSELSACTDDTCRANVFAKYGSLLTSLSSTIGQVYATQETTCNGIVVAGMCIPWWGWLLVGLFLALLLRR